MFIYGHLVDSKREHMDMDKFPYRQYRNSMWR